MDISKAFIALEMVNRLLGLVGASCRTEKEYDALGFFFWILLAGLIVALVVHYLK